MRSCPQCGSDRSWAVTWRNVEVFNRFHSQKAISYLSDDDETSFEIAEKIIECRKCGWEAPTTNEEEFMKWLDGDLFYDTLDHMAYVGELFTEET